MNWTETWEQLKLQLKTIDQKKLETFALDCEEQVFLSKGEWLCPNHPLEVPLYTYYEKKELDQLSDIGIHKMYHELARRKREQGLFSEALAYYEKAIKYNPVDLDILFDFATYYRDIEEYEKFKSLVDRLYFYCFTRTDIAWYYRLQGNYYLQKMKPQLAKNLYDYSNLFFETESAIKEIEYLKKAMGDKLLDASLEDIQKSLVEEEIPRQVCSSTLGFVYKIAKQSIEVGNTPYGKQLLIFLYEITADEEIKKELEDINK